MTCQLPLEAGRDKLEEEDGENVSKFLDLIFGAYGENSSRLLFLHYLDKSYWSRVAGSVTKHS